MNPNSATVSVHGVVVSPAGHPVEGAVVAAVDAAAYSRDGLVTTGSDGRFAFELKPARYKIAAIAPGFSQAVSDELTVSESDASAPSPQELRLGEPGALIAGRVVDPAGRPVPGALVRVDLWESNLSDVLVYTKADERGRFSIQPGPGQAVVLSVDGPTHESLENRVRDIPTEGVEILAYDRAELRRRAPKRVVEWIRAHAAPLTGVEPGTDLEDLDALAPMLDGVRVVGLGEATHGSREFFQVKHRLVEYLVAEHGFNVFAIEASWPEARAVDRYILTGEGDPAEALAGMHFWTWDTEEVLALIHWMRRYNADTRNTRKLRFVGVDMQYSARAVQGVLEYVARVAPDTHQRWSDALAPLADAEREHEYPGLDPETRKATRAAIGEIVALFDEESARFARITSDDELAVARQYLDIVRQVEAARDPAEGTTYIGLRDRFMADNVRWIFEHYGDDAKIALWAHNIHVGREPFGGFESMGGHLSEAMGSEYMALGLLFYRGAFQARDAKPRSESRGVVEHVVGPVEPHFAEAAMAATGLEAFLLDLHGVPQGGEVAAWFSLPHPVREYGGVFVPDSYPWGPVKLTEQFDGLVFIEATTSARPTPTGRRGPPE